MDDNQAEAAPRKPQRRKDAKTFTKDWLSRTHKRLESKPAGDEVLWDKGLQRFGARLKAKTITFMVQYRVRLKGGGHSTSRRYSIGKYPAWDLDTAREEAKRLLREADCGRDPLAARVEAEKAVTMAQLADEYWSKLQAGGVVRRKGEKHSRETIRTEQYRLNHIKAALGHKRASELTQRDIEAAKDRWIDEGKGAKRTLVSLGALLDYGSRHYPDIENVARGVTAPDDRQRDISLSPAQYAALGAALAQAEAAEQLPWQFPYVVRLLAVTGCRRSEILQLRWSEVDFERGALRLVRTETRDVKTKRSIRPLPSVAAAILYHVHEEWSKRSEFVFPAKGGGCFTNITDPWRYMLPDSLKAIDDGKPLTPHGLRHAFKNSAILMGIGELTQRAMMGHSLGKDASTGYVASVVVDQIAKDASERVASAIAGYMRGETNVVPMMKKEG